LQSSIAIEVAVEMGGSCPVDEFDWRKVSSGWFLWAPLYRGVAGGSDLGLGKPAGDDEEGGTTERGE
jgi:hypothetical protein